MSVTAGVETGTVSAAASLVLEANSISKSFGGVAAVKSVDLAVTSGEVVAIVGENGAGKSTLMKIIAGVYPAESYSGSLAVSGVPTRFRNVRAAEAAGIVLVPQELYIAPELSIAENMFMGRLPGRFGFVDRDDLAAQARERLRFFGITASPHARASVLSPSEQRLVTIASALAKTARLVILDEPTAALTDAEAGQLFTHIRKIRAEGIPCLYISHRLDEIEQIADRVVVMRNGAVVARLDHPAGRNSEIVRAMIGHDPERAPRRAAPAPGASILRVRRLEVHDTRVAGKRVVSDINFDLRPGEILGLFGLVGAGRTELGKALFGAWPGAVSGEVTIGDRAGRPHSPRQAIDRGLGMLTENRKQTGLFEGQRVLANISAASLGRVSGRLLIDVLGERRRGADLLRQLDVRPPSLEAPIESFSGGNQQKILLARWLATNPRVLILDEPTLGVDIGARLEIYRLIRSMADEGKGILMISSDINEVLDECDRILVMYKGRVTAEFDGGAARHDLMAAATGRRN